MDIQNQLQLVLSRLQRHLTLVSVVAMALSLVVFLAGPMRLLANTHEMSIVKEHSANQSRPLLLEAETDYHPASIERMLIPDTIIPEGRPRNKITTYMVTVGDTLEGIATLFGLNRESIFWANTAVLHGDVHMLMPETELTILAEDGALHISDETMTLQEIADKYSVSPQDIIESPYNELNGYTAEMTPPWGMRIVATGGIGEFADWRAPIVEVTDPVSGRSSTAFMPGMGGSCAGNPAGAGGSGAWTLPVPSGSYSITTPFTSYHSGIDLAAVTGTAVYATDTGVVVFSGWNDWGYGTLVVLDHGNGWTSYYAHMSNASVGCGQIVQRGSRLGAVGSTGNSSGPHLHFELRWNHTPDSPASYIGF